MLLRRTLGIIIVLSFFGILWMIAEVYSLGFHLSDSGSRVIYGAAFLFGAVFLFSFLSSRWSQAKRFSFLFKLFNMFTAFVFYLFPLAIALSIVLGVFSLSASTSILISTIFVSIAGLIGIIGILQARFIRTVSHTVLLKNAPKSWDGRTAVLVSDTHFGLIRNVRFSNAVVRKILALNPAFVLHAGDFYDGPMINLPPVTEPWKMMAQKIPVFYTPGNHESYGDFNAFVASVRETGATTLLDEKTEYDGVQIAGITYRRKDEERDAVQAITHLNLDSSKPVILINHPPTFHHAVADAGVQLMVSGHTHGGAFWPVNYIVWMLYGKYINGLHAVGTLTAITTRGVGTAGPPCRFLIPPEIVVLRFRAE
jgi:predicted MPP superfamily phosphohydrolase